jgi:hypothetical protein
MSATSQAPVIPVDGLAQMVAWRFPGMDLGVVDIGAVQGELTRVFTLLSVLESIDLPDDLFTVE